MEKAVIVLKFGTSTKNSINDEAELYMVFSPDITIILLELLKEIVVNVISYVYNNKLYVRLLKYLYGLKQSSKKFHDYLRSWLASIGYSPSRVDVCLYIKRNKSSVSYLTTHVDDIMVTGNTQSDFISLESNIKQYFSGEASHQYGDKLNHLGLLIIIDRSIKKTQLVNHFIFRKY